MKLTIVIMIACLLQVGATTKAQITLKIRSESMQRVLENISKQSGYDFVYSTSDLKELKATNIDLNNVTIETALKACFANQPLQYEIADKTVMIKRKADPTFLDRLADRWAAIDVHGRVVDQEGKPLPGATVKVKGTGKSVSTNGKGEFYLDGVEEEVVLVVSFIGYVNKEVNAKRELGNIVLKIAIGELDEVTINKGYYTQKKELSTGSVGTLKAADIEKQPISNPLTALQGRLPGIYISQNSGVTGSTLKINIRGQNSLRLGANEPLYMVDGIPFNNISLAQTENAAYLSQLSPFNSIRPEDIESIDVLRDADATAIYGSRGANGVILITTKRPSAGTTVFNINVYQGASKVPKFYDLMNTAQYLEMRTEGLKNDNRAPVAAETDINGAWAADNNAGRNTDWQKVLIAGTGKVTNANASISGGNSQLQYIVGLSYRKETYIYPGDFNNKVGSANVSITHTSENNKLQLSTSINYSNNNNKLPTKDLTQYIFLPPNAPELYDANGNLNWQNNKFNNPLGILFQSHNSVAENFIGNISGKYAIVNGLDFKVNFAYNSLRFDETRRIPYISIIPSTLPAENERSIALGRNDVQSWISEPQLSYSKSFGENRIDALVGTTFQSSTSKGSTQTANGFSSDILLDNYAAGTIFRGTTIGSEYKYNALFARIGYSHAEKYVINLTGRRDGSTRFGPGEQYGNFGAIGAAWIFVKENWIAKHFPVLSFGKLRASLGTTGNDQISDYSYLSLYGATDGYFGTSTLLPTSIGNPYYHWERINKTEVALELGFMQNRIRLNTSYYRNRTKNQLVGYNLPSITGFGSITANLPAVIQNNGLEMDLSTTNVRGKVFSWITSANLTVPRNKLVEYTGLQSSPYANTYRIGQPLDLRFFYKYTGLDQNTGLYTVQDLDKDGIINFDKDKQSFFVGQKFYGGINNTFSYKGISLDIFFQFVKQNGISFLGATAPGRYRVTGSNMPVDFLDRWQKPGDDAKYQKYTGGPGVTATSFDRYSLSDAVIQDASFIKLRNVSLSWQLPSDWVKVARLKNARIYFQGQNLLTITKYVGLDPEIASSSNSAGLPVLRVITGGIQISL